MDLAAVDTGRLRRICEQYGVASLEVFGSVSRGEDTAESDIDLLYVLKPDTQLGFEIFDLEDALADLFGRPVDLVSRHYINRHLRTQIVHDARPLYAA